MRNSGDFKNYKQIPLFYWSEIHFISRKKENYGDLLSRYLVEKISRKETIFVHPKKQAWHKRDKKNLLAVGSIIHHASKHSIVWGSGIIDHAQHIKKADFRAIRGPLTRDHLLSLGYECPEVYGDPAILLPDYFNPKADKKFDLGVIPHYHDFEKAKQIFADRPGIKVIDLLTLSVETTTLEILECERIISTSLHGLIVAQAYGIPAVWIKMSDRVFGNDIKYTDYLESVGLQTYEPQFIEGKISTSEIDALFSEFPTVVSETKLSHLKENLLTVRPF